MKIVISHEINVYIFANKNPVSVQSSNRGQSSCSTWFEPNSVAVTDTSNISCCDYDTDSNTIVVPNSTNIDDYLPAIGKGTDVNCAYSIGNMSAEVSKMKLDIKTLQSFSKP